MTDRLSALLSEATSIVRAAQGASRLEGAGDVGVAGVLAEQLARELGAGAEAGSVRVVQSPGAGIAVAVRVVAGDPSDEDRAFVSAAERASVPVVVVQVWPQEDWTPPFVLSPFVVECRAGEGFPLSEIVARIVEAADAPFRLAARIPTLRDAVVSRATRTAVARAALLGLRGRPRPLITLEQVRLAGQLRALEGQGVDRRPSSELAATTAALVAGGVVLREAARSLRGVLPEPVANAAVAACGTWALAEALRRVRALGLH